MLVATALVLTTSLAAQDGFGGAQAPSAGQAADAPCRVQLDDGRTGWLAARDVDLPPGTVLAQRFRRGKAIEARVVEDGDRRVTLSLREDPAEADRAWRQQAKASQKSSTGFGTLGDLLGGLNLPKK